MIISGTYYGDKADIWSVGCILLELMLGHEKFCDIWMTTYDYDILQDKEKFTEEIHATLDSLPDMLNFTEELNDFILKFLQIRSSIRPTAVGISAHTWLDGSMDDILSSLRASKLSVDTHANRPFTPPNLSPSPSISDMASSKNYQVDPETLKTAYNNLSERERRHIEEYILNQKDGAKNSDHQIHLPPIEPATPSLGNARKIMKKGDELASKASLENPQQFTFESHVIAQSPKSSSPSNSGFNSPMTSQRLSRTSSAMKTPLPGVSEVEVMTFSEELKTTTRKSSDAVLKSASERSSPKAFISSNSEKAFGKDDK